MAVFLCLYTQEDSGGVCTLKAEILKIALFRGSALTVKLLQFLALEIRRYVTVNVRCRFIVTVSHPLLDGFHGYVRFQAPRAERMPQIFERELER